MQKASEKGRVLFACGGVMVRGAILGLANDRERRKSEGEC